jgi:hypothetical protein
MARPTSEQLQRLQDFLDSLPSEARNKCSLCNTTLTHIVKMAEAEVGVGTATVTRVLAEKVNETALPADRVTEGQLRDRVRRSAGEKESGRTAQIELTGNPAIDAKLILENSNAEYAQVFMVMTAYLLGKPIPLNAGPRGWQP